MQKQRLNSGRRDCDDLVPMLRLLKSERRLKVMPVEQEYWHMLVNVAVVAAGQLIEAVAVGAEEEVAGAAVPGLLIRRMNWSTNQVINTRGICVVAAAVRLLEHCSTVKLYTKNLMVQCFFFQCC